MASAPCTRPARPRTIQRTSSLWPRSTPAARFAPARSSSSRPDPTTSTASARRRTATSWAVGASFDRTNGRQFTLIERADPGGRYVPEASPSPSNKGDSLLADMAAIGSDLWAVGAYDGPNAQRSLILHNCHMGAPAAGVAR